MSEELIKLAERVEAKPCPFCAGRAVMRQDDDPGYPFYVTFDHAESCVMYAVPTDMFRSFATEVEAAKAWSGEPTDCGCGMGVLCFRKPADVNRDRIAFAIIEGSAGLRAAEHAKEFQTGNWRDALRSADTVCAALRARATPEHPHEG